MTRLSFAEMLARRNELLANPYDYGKLASYMSACGEKPIPPELAQAVFYKARTTWTQCPAPQKQEALTWLLENGFQPMG